MVNFCFYQKIIATKLKSAEQDPDLHTKYRQSKSFANLENMCAFFVSWD